MIYTLKELSELIKPIAEKYHLAAVYVFGSYARNEATTESDVDILIDREGSDIKSLLDLGEIYNELTELLQKEIDIVTVQTLGQNSTKERSPEFIYNVNKEKIKIYEKQ